MDLANKVIKSVIGLEQDSELITIEFTDGSKLVQQHYQDCCEQVSVEQVDSIPSKFIGAKVIEIVEKTNSGEAGYDSFTYTFYTLKTSKGYLDWRWYGTSNGYYSEAVSMKLDISKLKEVELGALYE